MSKSHKTINSRPNSHEADNRLEQVTVKPTAKRKVPAVSKKQGVQSKAAIGKEAKDHAHEFAQYNLERYATFAHYFGGISEVKRMPSLCRELMSQCSATPRFHQQAESEDKWLERVLGGALVRGYALALIHATVGVKAENFCTERGDWERQDPVLNFVANCLRGVLPLNNNYACMPIVREHWEWKRKEMAKLGMLPSKAK